MFCLNNLALTSRMGEGGGGGEGTCKIKQGGTFVVKTDRKRGRGGEGGTFFSMLSFWLTLFESNDVTAIKTKNKINQRYKRERERGERGGKVVEKRERKKNKRTL